MVKAEVRRAVGIFMLEGKVSAITPARLTCALEPSAGPCSGRVN